MQTKNTYISGRVQNTDYNIKITEIGGKIADINGLTTTATLTTVENEIPDVNISIKKKKRNKEKQSITKKF